MSRERPSKGPREKPCCQFLCRLWRSLKWTTGYVRPTPTSLQSRTAEHTVFNVAFVHELQSTFCYLSYPLNQSIPSSTQSVRSSLGEWQHTALREISVWLIRCLMLDRVTNFCSDSPTNRIVHDLTALVKYLIQS